MPKRIVPLSELKVNKAKPQDKDYKLFDGGGLHLLVTPSGGKLWRFDYRFEGKRDTITFRSYPEVSLADARRMREDARSLIAHGVDPKAHKNAAKAAEVALIANSFELLAREWHQHKKDDLTPDHAATILTRMEKDVFPWIGATPITEITAMDIKLILDRVKSRGVFETARRVRVIISQVFTYAIMTDRAQYDIAASLKSYLPPASKTKKHFAAVTDPKELAPLLRAIDGYQGGLAAQAALKLLPMLFVRPGELRHMEWAEMDLDAAVWNIPAGKMKMKVAHLVPLCSQAVAILKELKPLTGKGRFVFPSTRSAAQCMSDNTINAAFRRMGFDGDTVTGHGFRATARTIMDEVLHVRTDFIEHQLAHAVRDPNGRAYNRTAHLDERRKMMQLWADYLDGLKTQQR